MSDHTLLLGGAERKHTRVRGACDCGPAPSPMREAAWPSYRGWLAGQRFPGQRMQVTNRAADHRLLRYH
jgi:hypothetical protein